MAADAFAFQIYDMLKVKVDRLAGKIVLVKKKNFKKPASPHFGRTWRPKLLAPGQLLGFHLKTFVYNGSN